jgi:secernin
MVALGSATADGATLFGKNSDRQRNEAQGVELVQGATHDPGEPVRCTYITISQVGRTNTVLLSRPFWMWGAEMGANEHGVVIGNEGLVARSPSPEVPALTGMDLLRLGLERSESAREAVHVMTSLLGQHGQGGNCGHLVPAYYNNGFIVADSTEAFVLETIDRDWLIEQVGEIRALSNEYSISRPTQISSAMKQLLLKFGLLSQEHPDYAALLPDPQRAHINSAYIRQARSGALMFRERRRIHAGHMMHSLRDHDPTGRGDSWNPALPHSYSLCIHAGADERNSQTTGSLVSEIGLNHAVHWVTGTAAPCISIFKPVLMDVPIPAHGPVPTDRFDECTLWWRHEQIHRRALRGHFPSFIKEIADERDALEEEFLRRMRSIADEKEGTARAETVHRCWSEASAVEVRWLARLKSAIEPAEDSYMSTWQRMNIHAGVPD